MVGSTFRLRTHFYKLIDRYSGFEHHYMCIIRPVARPAGGGGPKFQNEIFRPWRELGGGELGKSGQNIYSQRKIF